MPPIAALMQRPICRPRAVTGSGSPALLFSTDFSGDTIGQQPATSGSVSFGGHKGSVNSSVQLLPSGGGAKALRFFYEGTPPGSQNNSQCSFDVGSGYAEFVIEFDIHIPANYNHRDASPNNHKLYRLFPATSDDFGYGSLVKVGASMWRNTNGDGGSRVNNEFCYNGTGMGEYFAEGNGSVEGFIAPADFGTMLTLKYRHVAPTASTDSVMEIYKNGILIDSFGIDNYVSGEPNVYQRGYLFGAPNGGYLEDTYFYISRLEFYGAA